MLLRLPWAAVAGLTAAADLGRALVADGLPWLLGARGPHRVEGRLRRTLRLSVVEGMGAELFNAFGAGTMLTAWALHFGSGPFTVSLMAALPSVAQAMHFPAALWTGRLGGRTVALRAIAVSRLSLALLVPLPFVPMATACRLGLLVAVAAVSSAAAMVANNGWATWMGALVPAPVRGRYFGRRTALCTLASALGGLAGSAFLDLARRHDHEAAALSFLALAATAVGAVTVRLMASQHEPPHVVQQPSLRALWSPWLHAPTRRLVAYSAGWNGAIGLSSGFFLLFMLRDLRMDYTLVAVHGLVGAAARIAVAPAWGRAIDHVGARRVLVVCTTVVATIPLWWLLPTPDQLWPVFLDAVLTGVFWGGHNLAMFHLPLSLTPQDGRARHLALLSAAGGVVFTLSGLLGGGLVERWPATLGFLGRDWSSLQAMFVGSSVLRLGTVALAARVDVAPSGREARERRRASEPLERHAG
jgi:MFS family permease